MLNIISKKEITIYTNNILKVKKCKGRPTIPKSLKEYLSKKHACKINENMKNIYTNSKKYIKIEENKLNKEDI